MKKLKLLRIPRLGTIAAFFKKAFIIKVCVFILLIALPLLIIVCSQEEPESNQTNSNTLYFPTLRTDQECKTAINIVNLEDKTVDINLSSNNEDAKPLQETSSTNRLDAGETMSIETGSRSIVIESNGNILGTTLIETTDGKKSELIPGIKEGSTQLDFPTLVDGDTIPKSITLFNMDPSPANIEVVALDSDGRLIEQNTPSALFPMESRTYKVGELFSSQSLGSVSTIEVISERPIVGIQLVNLPEGDMVGLPALTTMSKGWSFPITTKGGDLELWTTVGILNPGNTTASITLEAFDISDNSLGVIENVTLSSGVTHFVTTANIEGIIPIEVVALKVTSDQLISGYEVIGVVNGSGLAATLGIPKENLGVTGFEVVGSEDGDMISTFALSKTTDGNVKSTAESLVSGKWKQNISVNTKKSMQSVGLSKLDTDTSTTRCPISCIPFEPFSLTATILNSTSIALYWDDNSTNEDGFIIERKIGNGGWKEIMTVAANSTDFKNNYYVDSCSPPNICLNTDSNTYYYKIRAYNDSGKSNYSNDALAVSLKTSDGFDFPVGDKEGNGTYTRNDNGQVCIDTYVDPETEKEYNWYVAADVMDKDYPNKNGGLHPGEDWNGACGLDTDLGEPVYAASLGRVVFSGYVPTTWGNVVLIAHKLSSGEVVYTQYAHLGTRNVGHGDQVTRRKQIGIIGNMAVTGVMGSRICNPDGTGNCAHLHFEVRKTTVGVGNWPKDPVMVNKQYYDPSDRVYDQKTNPNAGEGFIGRHRSNSGGIAPSAITDSATDITSNSAIINGTANPNGLSTKAYFQWGTNTSYGNTTAPVSVGSGTSNVKLLPVSLNGLSPNTSYHYRVVASNSAGISYGSDKTFTTASGGICSTTLQLLANKGFEKGNIGWATTSGVIDNSTSPYPARTGSWKAWLNGNGTISTDFASQQILIPLDACSATLVFWLRIDSAETTTSKARDKLKIQILNTSGTLLANLATYSNLNETTGYVRKSFNLKSYKGLRIRIKFFGIEDFKHQTSFLIDDAAVRITR